MGASPRTIAAVFPLTTILSCAPYVPPNRSYQRQDPRVIELEELSDGWRYKHRWRLLQLGMDMTSVQAALGEPDSVTQQQGPLYPITSWRYRAGFVMFQNGKVGGWAEPDWRLMDKSERLNQLRRELHQAQSIKDPSLREQKLKELQRELDELRFP